MPPEKKVNLFVVGLPKAGTTALYHYFKQHKDIYCKVKEPYYFAQDLQKKRVGEKKAAFYSSTYSNYIDKYSDATSQKYLTDMTPSYIFSEETPERIYKYNPEAKIIVIFREPVNWLRSFHAYMLYGSIENEKIFSKALELEEQRKSNKEDSFLYYSELIKYDVYLNRYLEYFPKKQVKVILHEKFLGDNISTLNDISNFLGIEKFENIKVKTINSSVKSRFPKIRKLVWKFPWAISFLGKFLPDQLFNQMTELYISLTTKKSPKDKIDENTKINLKRKYKVNVIKFEKLLKKYGFIKEDFSLIDFWEYD